MTQVNADNERIKRRYIRHMQEARGLADSTIDNALRALLAYERFTAFRDFGKFRVKDAISFKRSLLAGGGKEAAEGSHRSTIHNKLQPLQRFLTWLAEQPGFRTKIQFSDVEYLNLPNRDVQIARDQAGKPAPALEQVQHAIRCMPSDTDLEKRDRAVMCCALLTGARVMALATLKLRHIRSDRLGIDQDARDVRTKFSKSFTSFFLPVGDDIRGMFLEYVDFLRDLRFNGEDSLFPRTKQAVGDACHIHTVGLSRKHWSTADPVRRIFRQAFARAGIPYYTPHALRRTLTLLGQRICRTPEELKAWSQSLAHNSVLTTFTSYGAVPFVRQAEILTSLRAPVNREEDAAAFEAFKSMRNDPRFQSLFGSS